MSRRTVARAGSLLGTLVVLATVAVAGATTLLVAAPATPAAASGKRCVAVVVDFRQHGGALRTACAKGDPSSGLQALQRAGFGYTPRPRDNLICQIDAQPACSGTTPTTYWSYWYRARGSSRWVYATEGAATHDPRPGSSEAWVWQDGGRTPPPAIAAATICPQLSASPPPTARPDPSPTRSHTGAPSPPPATSASASTARGPARSHAPGTTSSVAATAAPSAASAPPGTDPSASTASSSSAAGAATGTSPSPSAVGADGLPADGSGGALTGVAAVAAAGLVVAGIGTAAVLRARHGPGP